MEYDERYGPDGLRVRVPRDLSYRTCSDCGGDCHPDPSAGTDSTGIRIALVCPKHGVNSIVDPFEDKG